MSVGPYGPVYLRGDDRSICPIRVEPGSYPVSTVMPFDASVSWSIMRRIRPSTERIARQSIVGEYGEYIVRGSTSYGYHSTVSRNTAPAARSVHTLTGQSLGG
jgi:hypothetical protein